METLDPYFLLHVSVILEFTVPQEETTIIGQEHYSTSEMLRLPDILRFSRDSEKRSVLQRYGGHEHAGCTEPQR